MFRRHVFVRQNDQSDCGAAALATVALHHGVSIGLQQMRHLAGTDRVGTNLLGLVRAAEQIGLSATAVKGPYDALLDVPLPAVAHVNTEEGLGHFVVLRRVTKRGVVIADPARGVLRQSRDEFCRRWTGYLLIVTRNSVQPARVSPTAPTAPWRRLVGLLASHKSVVAEAFVCAVLMTLLGISTSYFVQHLVDSVLVRGEMPLLNALGIGMLLIVVFRTAFGVLRQYLLAHVARKIDLALVAGYARHLLHLPISFFEMRQVGEILSRVNDAVKVRQAISGTALALLVDGVLVMFTVSVLWLYDARLAAVATAFVPLLLLSITVHHPPIKNRSREAMEQSARLSAHLVEDISGVDTIKAFGLQPTRTAEGESRLLRVVQSIFSLQKLGISMSSSGALVTALAGVIVLWYGGHRVIAGALSLGQLLFFYTLLGYMLGPLERLASVNLQIQDALVAVNRLYEILDVEPEKLGDGSEKLTFDRLSDGIRLESVSFSYGCRDRVLNAVDLVIPAGSTVAVVGESGSGKSTLLKLLTRFYDPTAGRIVLDGHDLRDYGLASLRSRIGLVAQDPFIFNGTVRENIALAAPNADMNQIAEAARAAGLDQFIASLPERYGTVIGERGANLSGGQRQRLAIARALLREPEILIFDEATSHLDTATEQAIQSSLRTALANRTVVLVAHRLSTIRDADIIYVLHEGQVVEQGTHRELLARQGRYAALWDAQTDSRRDSLHEPPRSDLTRRLALKRPNGNGRRHGNNGGGRFTPCETT